MSTHSWHKKTKNEITDRQKHKRTSTRITTPEQLHCYMPPIAYWSASA